MIRILLIICGLVFNHIVFSQNSDYAKFVVDTLSSEYFEGRGAVNDGEKKAAEFLAKEFKKFRLKNYNDSYLQSFNYPINTIVGDLSVQIDNTLLTPGEDYIVGANSNGIIGTFEIVWYNKKNVPTKKQLKKLFSRNFFKNKFIVIDDEGVPAEDESFQQLKYNLIGAAGIIFLEDKLTKDLARTYQDYAILKVLKTKINRDYKKIKIEINQKFVRNYQSQNVMGFVEGTEFPDSFVVVSAHYDHLGRMGNQVYFSGANDNASGVAVLLSLADYYTRKEPPKKTMLFIAFGAEEPGIIGSKYFIDHSPINLKHINFEINLDVIGTGDDGLMVVNGAVYEQQFQLLQKINSANQYTSIIKKRGKAANSDHYWFSEKGIPAFFIYAMGGVQAYHDVYDVSKTLPLTYFDNTFRLIRDFIDEL